MPLIALKIIGDALIVVFVYGVLMYVDNFISRLANNIVASRKKRKVAEKLHEEMPNVLKEYKDSVDSLNSFDVTKDENLAYIVRKNKPAYVDKFNERLSAYNKDPESIKSDDDTVSFLNKYIINYTAYSDNVVSLNKDRADIEADKDLYPKEKEKMYAEIDEKIKKNTELMEKEAEKWIYSTMKYELYGKLDNIIMTDEIYKAYAKQAYASTMGAATGGAIDSL